MAEKTAGIDIVWRNYVTGTYVFSFTIVQYIDDKLSAIAVYCCSSLRNQDLDLHPGRQYAVLFTTLITSEFSLIAARSKLRKVLFLATVCDFFVLFFVCASNISGTAERICAKLTRKTCLSVRVWTSKVKGQGHLSTPINPGSVRMVRPRSKQRHSSRRRHSVAAVGDFGGLCAIYVLQNTLALVLVHGQVTIIFVVSVCLSVCLFVCLFVQNFSQPSSIRFGSN